MELQISYRLYKFYPMEYVLKLFLTDVAQQSVLQPNAVKPQILNLGLSFSLWVILCVLLPSFIKAICRAAFLKQDRRVTNALEFKAYL